MFQQFTKTGWWLRTAKNNQKVIEELATKYGNLGDIFNGLIGDEDSELVKINSLVVTEEFVVVNLEYRSKFTNQLVNREIVVNKMATETAGRCLVSVVNGNDKKILLFKKGSLLTFFPDFSKSNLCQFPQKFIKELDLWLGKQNWQVSKIIDLGSVNPNRENGIQNIPIFWVEMKTSSQLTKIEEGDLSVWNYELLSILAEKTNDAIALSIIARRDKLDQDETRNKSTFE
jgi:hypothetical protein